MPILLPVLAFVLMFLIVLGRSGPIIDWRQLLLSTWVVWTLLLLVVTETLSAFDLLTREGLAAAWATLGAGSAILLFFRSVKLGPGGPLSRHRFCGLEVLLLTGVVVIMLTTLIIALTSPPNTWDSMTYHMSRVMHWIQNGNVKHYPTNIGQQVFLPPLAEYVITHFQVLMDHDRFANMVQWGAMVGSAVGVSLIARELGAGLSAQWLASFLGLTLPIGILQASSTQNDYVSAFWLITLSYFLLRLQKEPKWNHAAMSGICLGLAWLTKPTSYLYSAPFLVVTAWTLVRKVPLKGLSRLALTAAIAMALNLPHFARNVDTFGHPFGPVDYNRFNRNEIVTPASIASNLVRNVALHLATPWRSLNQVGESGVRMVHRFLGLDVNDERTTFFGMKFGIVFSNHEDSAGNLLHLVLLVGCGFLLLFLRHEPWVRPCIVHLACVGVGFALLCTFIRWNPWNSRYHLALFLLAAPVMAIAARKVLDDSKLKWLVILVFAGSLPWVVYNFSRPLVGYPSTWKGKPIVPQLFKDGRNIFTSARTDLYFSNRWEARNSYFAAADYLAARGIRKIGIELGGDDWEYPFFPLLKRGTHAPVQVEHVLRQAGAEKGRAKIKDGFVPEAVICLRPEAEGMVRLGDTRFEQDKVFGPVRIFLPKSGPPHKEKRPGAALGTDGAEGGQPPPKTQASGASMSWGNAKPLT